ncbi:energy-coupling factor transport system substrate-specific component [Clostridium cavendishii DSM 21758]|uniref:Energy-coupling factor transport system substrate-specific component n=1 Tax=Clostridium cavendishii DSM 21758 TaxID=1121302 RepID=A0A1M6DH92_9CLOT|nr:MptD family putative ECF transporter S component [Clostridium cavendishii]SHI72368.1 energy-coupling factor transport system substrate-specific component [Clostridium cavendishii DSM 21758]
MSNKKNKSDNVRKLITIGVFNALLIVVFFGLAFTIGLFPPILVVIPIIISLVGGIIFMLMIAKAEMPGIFIISSALLGLTLLTMAPGGVMGICIFVMGIIGEIIFTIMGRKKFISAATGFACYMLGFALGEYIPFVFMKEAYIAQESAKGSESLQILKTCLGMVDFNTMILLSVLTIIASYLGSLWGKKLLHKHFEKAGIV